MSLGKETSCSVAYIKHFDDKTAGSTDFAQVSCLFHPHPHLKGGRTCPKPKHGRYCEACAPTLALTLHCGRRSQATRARGRQRVRTPPPPPHPPTLSLSLCMHPPPPPILLSCPSCLVVGVRGLGGAGEEERTGLRNRISKAIIAVVYPSSEHRRDPKSSLAPCKFRGLGSKSRGPHSAAKPFTGRRECRTRHPCE